jgi:hypothetical protein
MTERSGSLGDFAVYLLIEEAFSFTQRKLSKTKGLESPG